MSKVLEKHIDLVVAVNESKTEAEHRDAENRLRGFREAIQLFGINYGNQLMECDMYYINQGVDAPMCCGVFLDWEPHP